MLHENGKVPPLLGTVHCVLWQGSKDHAPSSGMSNAEPLSSQLNAILLLRGALSRDALGGPLWDHSQTLHGMVLSPFSVLMLSGQLSTRAAADGRPKSDRVPSIPRSASSGDADTTDRIRSVHREIWRD